MIKPLTSPMGIVQLPVLSHLYSLVLANVSTALQMSSPSITVPFVDKDQVRYIAQVSTYLFLGGAYAASAP